MNERNISRRSVWSAAAALAIASLLIAAPASAELQWVSCQVESTGVGKEAVRGIRLSHVAANPLFVSKWYRARDDAAEDMLALAVWAMSTGTRVSVQLDPFAADWSPIEKFYIEP